MISIIQFTYSEVKGYHGYQHVKMPLPKLIILRRKGFAYTIYQFILTERGAFFFLQRETLKIMSSLQITLQIYHTLNHLKITTFHCNLVSRYVAIVSILAHFIHSDFVSPPPELR